MSRNAIVKNTDAICPFCFQRIPKELNLQFDSRAMEIRLQHRTIRRSPSECWLWTGSKTGQGYGRVYLRGQPFRAHRIAYMLATKKPIPVGKTVLHKCDNPSCVNPSHLFLGDNLVNARDMIAKGRYHGGSKINLLIANKIRGERQLGTKVVDLARRYQLDRNHVTKILTYKVWKNNGT